MFGLGQERHHHLSVQSPDGTPLDHVTPIRPRRNWLENWIK